MTLVPYTCVHYLYILASCTKYDRYPDTDNDNDVGPAVGSKFKMPSNSLESQFGAIRISLRYS